MSNQLSLLPQGITLADIERAELPALYIAARNALAACARIDECKNLQDKYSAIARYAKQARNDELLKLCKKIALRAERKMGQLILTVEKSIGGHNSKGRGRYAQFRAVLCKDAMNRAMAISSVPEAEFESVVESGNPPGRVKYSYALRNRGPGSAVSERDMTLRALKSLARVCEAHPARNLVGSFTNPHFNAKARALLLVCGPWIQAVAQVVAHDSEPATPPM